MEPGKSDAHDDPDWPVSLHSLSSSTSFLSSRSGALALARANGSLAASPGNVDGDGDPPRPQLQGRHMVKQTLLPANTPAKHPSEQCKHVCHNQEDSLHSFTTRNVAQTPQSVMER
eukprot:m.29526 g.29526  ORF g.29526 m.29526 type:complete len:116 (+) comp9174_c0_seq2:1194-1541(+)